MHPCPAHVRNTGAADRTSPTAETLSVEHTKTGQTPSAADSSAMDLSPAQLTEWLWNNFSRSIDSDDKIEQPAVSVADTGSWITSFTAEGNDFDHKKVRARELPGGLDGCGLVLENVLTRKECQRIIAKTEGLGYGLLGRGKTGAAYRGNQRVQMDDVTGALGAEIWRRISEYVPTADVLPDEEGVWGAEGLNSRFRFAKYSAGEGFAKHVDKPTIFEPERCSILTVNIYLNDLAPEQGGRTRFYTKPGGFGQPAVSAGGCAGSLVLFKQAVVEHSPWHDGERLEHGLKYLMRTDVIYNKVPR
ncbi:hypothetical protein CYMTET_26363 [Cymbomonas tetramitiformis]|uniref:Fe2OG dioxygenase domain-containing protein n=1 Tax=Cymbomonas tetramitiformis TaxID=36881 RepID=A0AAE0FRZ6_9CHLO|nr:hypothetical protein CYMTET_26363 [Cymbomonas tetramitiformis]|eukprot:gene12764-15090_t